MAAALSGVDGPRAHRPEHEARPRRRPPRRPPAASSARGDPADLHEEPPGPAITACRVRATRSAAAARGRRPGSGARMRCSPTRKASKPASRRRRTSAPLRDAALRHRDHVVGDAAREVERGLRGPRPCVCRSRLLTPTMAGADGEGALELVARRAPRRAPRGRASAPRPESARSSASERAATIRSTASAPASQRLPDLVGIDHEVLAQGGQQRGRARLLEVLEAAAEELLLGEHGERRGAGRPRRPAPPRPGCEVLADRRRARASAA